MSGQKFSLSFSKKVEKKSLQPSAISNEAPKPQQPLTQALQAVDQHTWKTDVRDAPENQLVIPRLPDTRYTWLQKGGDLLETGNDQETSRNGGIDGDGKKSGEEREGKTHTGAEKRKETTGSDLNEQIGKEDANEGPEKHGKANTNEDAKNSLKKGKESKAVDTDVKKPLTLDEQAAEALLEESRRRLDQWTGRDPNANLTIASSSQENTLSSAVVDVGKEATDDDYEQINIESFGAAVLRGLGWKKTEGVGGMGKRVVEIIDPSVKTLSLTRTSKGSEGEGPGGSHQEGADLPLVKGAYVFLHSGRHRGTYGVVETVDEDHVLVKAAMTHAVVREVELNLRVVTTAEYKESSRVINKDKYDKYKEEEARKKAELTKKSKNSGSSDDSSQDSRRKRSSETKTKSRFKEPLGHRDRDKEDTSSRGKSRDGQEETGRELKQRLDSESKERTDKSREARDSERSENRKRMDNIKESRESERIDRRDDKYKIIEGRKRDDEPKGEHNKHPEKERRKDGDVERRDDREEKEKIDSRKNDEPKRESDDKEEKDIIDSRINNEPKRVSDKYPEERDMKKKEKYNTQSSGKSGERREQDDERQIDRERREREKRERGSERERDGEKRDGARQRDADKRNRDGERDRAGEKKETQRDDSRSKERRDPEEERRLSERERIRMKYESQADGKWGGKRGMEEDGYTQSSKKFEHMPVMPPWVRENLRVRLISKTYKDGKYHKEKMVVRSVVTAERCECEVESGRTLRDVNPACLETVIPKLHPYLVMIVKGDSKGQLGRILQLHKEQEKASIQLLEDDTVIVKRHYEDICEYVR